MNPIVYRVPGMEAVQPRANLHYSDDSDPLLQLDVYVPPALAPDARAPAVLLIHGGVPEGAAAKNAPFFQTWGQLLAVSGFVGVTFNHRLGYPKANLAQAGMDVAEALSYVRAHADELHIDADRIALFAFSAGGPLLGAGLGTNKAFIRCLLAFYALLDIRESPLHAEEGPAPFLRRWSPTAFYGEPDAAVPPIFVARAGQDMALLNALTDRFSAAALLANAPFTLVNHPAGRHGFDSLDDEARTHEIIAAALAFLRTHLGVTS